MNKEFDKLVKDCKRVETYNSYKDANGWLLEMMSDQDGWTENLKGQIYMSVVAPRNHKGFHVHARAMYHFVCVRGNVRSVIYTSLDEKREIEMGENSFKAIKVFPGEAHCLINDSDETAYILTYRDPAWTEEDPDILTVSPSEINTREAWDKIDYFNRTT